MNDLLKGIKVVELATFVAAPTAGRFLADLGAEVIKVETPTGDTFRNTAMNEGRPVGDDENTTFDLENSNKKSIALNLKSPAGKDILMRLIEKADVFITNWRNDALVRAGLDYETLKLKFPALVFAYVTGYGEKGPDKDLPGFDFTSYFARGGLLGTLYEKDTVPMNTIAGFGDHQVGMYLAAGIMAGLYRAKTTGKGEKVSVSLLHAAIFGTGIMLQASQYGHPSTQYPVSRKNAPNPLQIAHKTKDERFIQIAMPMYDAFYERFMKASGRDDLAVDPRYCTQAAVTNNLPEFYDIMVELFASKDLAEWKVILTQADIPFAVAQLWSEVLTDEQAWASDCLYAMKYPTGNTRTLVRQPVLFAETGLPDYNKSPYVGEQTVDILKSLNYSDTEIETMLSAKDAVAK